MLAALPRLVPEIQERGAETPVRQAGDEKEHRTVNEVLQRVQDAGTAALSEMSQVAMSENESFAQAMRALEAALVEVSELLARSWPQPAVWAVVGHSGKIGYFSEIKELAALQLEMRDAKYPMEAPHSLQMLYRVPPAPRLSEADIADVIRVVEKYMRLKHTSSAVGDALDAVLDALHSIGGR